MDSVGVAAGEAGVEDLVELDQVGPGQRVVLLPDGDQAQQSAICIFSAFAKSSS